MSLSACLPSTGAVITKLVCVTDFGVGRSAIRAGMRCLCMAAHVNDFLWNCLENYRHQQPSRTTGVHACHAVASRPEGLLAWVRSCLSSWGDNKSSCMWQQQQQQEINSNKCCAGKKRPPHRVTEPGHHHLLTRAVSAEPPICTTFAVVPAAASRHACSFAPATQKSFGMYGYDRVRNTQIGKTEVSAALAVMWAMCCSATRPATGAFTATGAAAKSACNATDMLFSDIK